MSTTRITSNAHSHASSKAAWWIVRGAWLLTAFLALQLVLYGFGRDQPIYSLIGEGILAGKMPYRDLWDIKPPGIYLVFAAAGLLGHNMWGVRVIEAFGLVAMVWSLAELARAADLPRPAGMIGGAFAALVYVQLGYWNTAQPEAFGGMLTAYGLAASAHAARRWQTRSPGLVPHALCFAAGLAFGCAFVLKPHLAAGAVMCALALFVHEYKRTLSKLGAVLPGVIMAVGSALPVLAVCVWFLARGAWHDLAWTLFEFTPHYTQLGWTDGPLYLFSFAWLMLFGWFSLLLPLGALAAMCMRPLSAAEPWLGQALFGTAALHMLGVSLQAKFIPYHFASTLPLLCLSAGIGFYKLGSRLAAHSTQALLFFISALIALDVARTPLYQKLKWDFAEQPQFWPASARRTAALLRGGAALRALDVELYRLGDYQLDDNRTVGYEIAARTNASDTVYVWGFEPAVYWFSGRSPATRYITNQPQRTAWNQEATRAELMTDLHTREPAVIAVQHGDDMEMVTGSTLDSSAVLQTFPELKQLLATQYVLSNSLRGFDLYAHRPQ
jgi:hypothetical protein